MRPTTATLLFLTAFLMPARFVAALTVRTTSDSCPNDHCTAVDETIAAGSCTVRGGKCRIDADVAPGYPSGAGSEMTVLGCGVDNGSLPTFTCGIMIP